MEVQSIGVGAMGVNIVIARKKARNTKIDLGFEEPYSLPPSGGSRKAITLRGEGACHAFSKRKLKKVKGSLVGPTGPAWRKS